MTVRAWDGKLSHALLINSTKGTFGNMTTLRARIKIAKEQGRSVLPMSIRDLEELLEAAERQNVIPLPTRKKLKMEVVD